MPARRLLALSLVALSTAFITASCGGAGGADPSAADTSSPDARSPQGADDDAARSDAPASADAAPLDADVDSAAPSKPCDPLGAWSTPVPVAALTTASNESSARLTADELKVYFASDRPGSMGGSSIYTAQRTSRNGTFGTPTLVVNVSTASAKVKSPAISGDGLRMVVEADFGAISGTDLYLATRVSPLIDFSTLTLIQNSISTGSYEYTPSLSADGLELLFSTGRGPAGLGGDYALYRSTWDGAGFVTPTYVAGINVTDSDDFSPVLSSDGLALYVASDRDNATGVRHVYVSRRTSKAVAFNTPTIVAELSSGLANVSDSPSWISADNCRIYMTSNRTLMGKTHIYLATRTPPP